MEERDREQSERWRDAPRRPYRSPELSRLGTARELTLGTSSSVNQEGTTPSRKNSG